MGAPGIRQADFDLRSWACLAMSLTGIVFLSFVANQLASGSVSLKVGSPILSARAGRACFVAAGFYTILAIWYSLKLRKARSGRESLILGKQHILVLTWYELITTYQARPDQVANTLKTEVKEARRTLRYEDTETRLPNRNPCWGNLSDTSEFSLLER